MQLHTSSRGGRRVSAAVLCCALAPLLVPAAVPAAAHAAVARERGEGPTTVRQGAWWFRKMRLEQAHRVSTGEGTTIALIDTGVDTSVPELRGADVRMGLDCRGRRAVPREGVGANHGTTQAVLLVGNGHGTGDGGAGVRGIAPDATVIAYDDDSDPGNDRLDCSLPGLERMFDDAVRRGADVISVAATMTRAVIPYVQRALDAGVVVVAASGADDVAGPTFPADLVGVVSVVAVDRNAEPWKRRRRLGSQVVAAPGVHVGTGAIYPSGWHSEGWGTGTSPATTITSGALALVKARYPRATGNQLVQHLVHYTGGDGPFRWSDGYGFGIVSVTEMLETSPLQWPDESPLSKVNRDTVQDYPMSASSLVAGSDDSADAGDGSPAPETGPDSDPRPVGADPVERAAAEEPRTGVPTWTWPAGAVLAAALVVGAAAVRKGRVRATSQAIHEKRGG